MINELRPYPEYKESGLPWLGKVPVHWEVRPAFTCYRPKLDRNTGMQESVVLSLSYGRIIVKAREKLHGLVPESFETYQIVRPGDIVIRTTDLQNDHNSLRIGHVRNRGIITSAYLCLEVTPFLSDSYGYQFLNAWDLTKAIYGYGSGLRQNLDFRHFKRMPVAVPPPTEQDAIVRFLQNLDAKVRRFILNRRRLIDALNEQKRAIIKQVVTRGLNHNVTLKPSGIDWVGDIPEHWQVRRIKTITKILRGKFSHRPRNDPSLYDGDFPFIQTGDVANASKYITKYKQTLNEKGYSVSKEFPKGTLTMTIAANIGDVAILDFDACFPDSIVGFVPNKEVFLDFLFYLFSAMKNEFLIEAPVNTQGNLNVERIGSMPVSLPDYETQQLIVAAIESELEGIEGPIFCAQREIDLIREYRTRLIIEAVTGKIDVCHFSYGVETEEVKRASIDGDEFGVVEMDIDEEVNDAHN